MIKYKQPKQGLFRIHLHEWDDKNMCWKNDLQKLEIVGEDNTCYITEFKTTSCGFWDEYGRYTAKYTIGLGVNKTRLEKWVGVQQLQLQF